MNTSPNIQGAQTPGATTLHALTAPGGQPIAALFTGEQSIEAALVWARECHAMREVLSARGEAWRRDNATRAWRRRRFGDEGERAATEGQTAP